MAGSKRKAHEDPRELHEDLAQFQPKKAPAQLDQNRATQCAQHVRALNSQFTSWVEKQHHDHPYELWQEGVEDYLRHASKILADFSDVVGWLKTKASIRSEKRDELRDDTGQFAARVGEAIPKSVAESSSWKKPAPYASQQVTPSITPVYPASSGLPFGNSTTGPGFSMAHTPTGNEGDDQEDGDIPNEPTSPSVRKSEEPGIRVVHEIKCKLYIKADDGAEKSWKDMGVGHVTLKCKQGVRRGTKEAKATIVFRNEVGRVLLNALLYPNIKMNIQKNTVTGIFHSADSEIGAQSENGNARNDSKEAPKPRLYLLKVKSMDEAEKLVEAITLHAPSME